MAKYYGWAHNYWRSPPRGPGIGWLELLAWCKAMNRAQQGPDTNAPDSWAGKENSAQWAEMRAQRDQQFFGR